VRTLSVQLIGGVGDAGCESKQHKPELRIHAFLKIAKQKRKYFGSAGEAEIISEWLTGP